MTTEFETIMGEATGGLAFIGRFSFESRWNRAFQQIDDDTLVQKHFFQSAYELDSEDAAQFYTESGLSNEEISFLNRSNPLNTYKVIKSKLEEIINSDSNLHILIDISTFSREEICIIYLIISNFNSDEAARIFFCYTPVADLGNWLSKGVKSVRPMLGYPGEIFSKMPTHLIVLAGIEHDRVISIIESFEPSKISLGMVPKESSLSPKLYKRNLALRDYLVRHFDNISTEFDFTATNPYSIVNKLASLCMSDPKYNTIISPLNTKLVTLGCAIFGVRNPKVQIAYSEVEIYNTESYSIPADTTLYYRLVDLIG